MNKGVWSVMQYYTIYRYLQTVKCKTMTLYNNDNNNNNDSDNINWKQLWSSKKKQQTKMRI